MSSLLEPCASCLWSFADCHYNLECETYRSSLVSCVEPIKAELDEAAKSI